MLRTAALIPLGVALQIAFADALTGADAQGLRTVIMGGGFCLIGVLAALGVNLGGVYGAILGVLAGHILLGAALLVAVEFKARR
jgi:hypothetical protein